MERKTFAACPKNEAYPKCTNCSGLIIKAECPLGRMRVPAAAVRQFGNIAFSYQDAEELSAADMELLTQIENKGVVAKPRSHKPRSKAGERVDY